MNPSMAPKPNSPWKRLSLQGITASVGISALLGIMALLSGDFGDLQLHVLFTTLTTSGASICALACVTLWEGKGQKYPALPGLVLAIVAAVLVCGGIWTEVEYEAYWKFAVTLTIYAVATAHMCLLNTADLQRSFRWSVNAAYLFTYGLASTLAFMLWAENGSEALYRFIGIQSIITVSLSIAIPVFHKLSSSKPTPNNTPIKMLCPHCQAEQSHPLGQITCQACQKTFKIQIP